MSEYEEQISQLETQVRQRMDQLASNDPLCNRIYGRIEVLREMTQKEEPVETESD